MSQFEKWYLQLSRPFKLQKHNKFVIKNKKKQNIQNF